MLRRLLPLLCTGTALIGCGEPPPEEWRDEGTHRWRPLAVGSGDGVGFASVRPRRSGVDFQNTLDPESALSNEHLLIGSGVALGDVDGDGRTDLYLARLEGPNALYVNRGGWRFEDVAPGAGVSLDDRYSTGAALADLDGDGDLDLVVTSLGGPDAVLVNDGSGRFTERADAGLVAGLGSTSPALADVDGDGDLDLYVTTYKARSASDELGMLARPASDLTGGTTDSIVIAPEFREHFRVEERNGVQVAAEQADPDRLYLNDGTGRFEPVPWTEGAFLDPDGRPLERDIDDFGLAAAFHDVDGDGHVDLYVCNDFDDPDQLWLGRGDGTFRAVARTDLRTTPHASMSVDFSDLDGDGSFEIFVAEMRASDHARWLRLVPFQNRLLKPPGRIEDRPQVQRNALYTRVAGAGWSEISEMAGVDASDWSWTSLFLDVDLDGLEDLLVVNGYSRDTQDGDIQDEITSLQGRATSREMKQLYSAQRTRNVAFRNRGDLSFEPAGDAWNFGTEEDISHGMAAGDLDGDGDLDLVVNRLGSPALLLRNEAEAPRIAVRLRGNGPNTHGVMATVRLAAEGGPTQSRQLTSGGLYLSGSEPIAVFGVPDPAANLRLTVEWPDGSTSSIADVLPNREYEVLQASAAAAEPPVPDSGSGRAATLFEDATSALGHTHPERPFEDFFLQPLLPLQLSRLGPGVSWIDVDGDGDPDLVVPPGAGGSVSWWRNDAGRFTEREVLQRTAELDLTAALPLPRSGRGPALMFGQSGHEAPDPEAVRRAPIAIEVTPEGVTTEVPAGDALGITGPLAAADVDGDGSLEVFVGGRAVTARYPLAASSALLRRVDGTWQRDASADTAFAELGMVSGAIFSDIDSDGDPDLLLATDWGPVRLLRNEEGRLVEATEEWGLAELTGRWNAVSTGDFDGDGRLDAVVTGWGRNVRFPPSPERPVTLYHGDLDGNGSWDLFPSRDMTGDGVLQTLVEYDLLRRVMPSLRRRVPDFRSYSEAPLRTILGTDRTYAREITTLDHLVLLNRGGRFEPTALPDVAQRAPSLGVAVGDLDGDGSEDLFLSQNFFPTHPLHPRYDAGYGVVLLGRGDGTFEPLPPANSGIAIYGDQRGAALADFDGDARIDLAVAQNGAATRLFRNANADRGIRVRLRGPASNPRGVGATIHLQYPDGSRGPSREVRLGGGYWSVDGAVQVFGVRSLPAEVVVQWPGGTEVRREVTRRGETVEITQPGDPS